MAESRTRRTGGDVDRYLTTIDEPRRSQAIAVRAMMARVTGESGDMWGNMIGFGDLNDVSGGRSKDWFVVGLAPRAAALTIYGVYDDYAPRDSRYDDLGPHTHGKGCLYFRKLDGVDLDVLESLVRDAWESRPR
jgi:hypothetical protein